MNSSLNNAREFVKGLYIEPLPGEEHVNVGDGPGADPGGVRGEAGAGPWDLPRPRRGQRVHLQDQSRKHRHSNIQKKNK